MIFSLCLAYDYFLRISVKCLLFCFVQCEPVSTVESKTGKLGKGFRPRLGPSFHEAAGYGGGGGGQVSLPGTWESEGVTSEEKPNRAQAREEDIVTSSHGRPWKKTLSNTPGTSPCSELE